MQASLEVKRIDLEQATKRTYNGRVFVLVKCDEMDLPFEVPFQREDSLDSAVAKAIQVLGEIADAIRKEVERVQAGP